MKRIAAILVSLAAWKGGALAMNWEGHDDWMRDHPAAVIFESMVPPPPRRPLPCVPADQIGKVPAGNVYEQVPLAHRACPEKKPGARSSG